MESIRKHIENEEFDYQTLLHSLSQYSRPRDKISGLLRSGVIIRVKKGIYIFGEDYRHRTFSREVLANLIYGPSYISLEYALHYFGLIPERVEAVTSVTTGRSRKYSTPVGLFTYRMIPLSAFRFGMNRVELDDGRSFLIATPEKALSAKSFETLMQNAIDRLDVDQARREVEPFVGIPASPEIWSRDFFRDVASRIQFV
jgi:hypothetical protein